MKGKNPFVHKRKIACGSLTGKTSEVSASDVLASMMRELEDWALTVPEKIIDAEVDVAVDWCVRDLWGNVSVEFVEGDIEVSHLCQWFEDDPLRPLRFRLSDLVREAADQAEESGLAGAFLVDAEKELTRCLRLIQARRERLKK